MRILSQLLLCLAVSIVVLPVMADPMEPAASGTSLLAQNTPQSEAGSLPPPPPASGTLIIPGMDSDTQDNTGKRCMTVCARWGEECSYINRGTAGTTRTCRRTCQQFKEECF